MKKEVKKVLLNSIDHPWEFVVEAAVEYKKRFKKTYKIGEPPSVDQVLGDMALAKAGLNKVSEEKSVKKIKKSEKEK